MIGEKTTEITFDAFRIYRVYPDSPNCRILVNEMVPNGPRNYERCRSEVMGIFDSLCERESVGHGLILVGITCETHRNIEHDIKVFA